MLLLIQKTSSPLGDPDMYIRVEGITQTEYRDIEFVGSIAGISNEI